MTMQWVRDLPSTNFRIVIGLGLSTIFVLVLLGAIVIDKKPDIATAGLLAGFLLTMLGLDVAQFKAKRDSYQATGANPPSPDPEDVPKPKTAPDPNPGDA